MKLKVKQDVLLKPLMQVGNVVERRQTLPILANILFDVSKKRLRLTATDLEVELSTQVAVNADQEAECTLPARKLIDICKALPDGAEITLEIDGGKATIRSGRGRYTLGTLSAQDYPAIESPTTGETFSVPCAVLKGLIDRTRFAMAQQDVRYYLNGLMLEVAKDRLRTVATDGHRLALCDGKVEGIDGSGRQIILPYKAVTELARLLADQDGDAKLVVSDSHIQVTVGDSIFTSKLIDGRFPDYERVMPRGEQTLLTGDRNVLRQALARTAILSNEKYRGIRVRVRDGLMHLQAHNPEQDEAEEEVEVDYQGDEMIIGFNVVYLLDVLGVIEEEEVEIGLTDANSSALVTPKGRDDCRYVIMPMRL